MADPLMLACTRVSTFAGDTLLTQASGFFFERDARLYLVTSAHVAFDPGSGHSPDRLELEVHLDRRDLTRAARVSVPLYRHGLATWRQASDSGGPIDVAVVPLERAPFDGVVRSAFTPAHLQQRLEDVEVGQAVLVVGFPLGFHDTLHHLPVARLAGVASAFGVRFQGQGYFLTDARTHRGTSGAPVVMRLGASPGPGDALPWRLLGVHSSRMDMNTRDPVHDESLGLNSAWYADVLLVLTST